MQPEIRFKMFTRNALHGIIHSPISSFTEDTPAVDFYHHIMLHGFIGCRHKNIRRNILFQTRHTHASFYIFAVYIIKDRFALPHNRRTIFHPADRVIGETNFQFIRKLTDSETNFLRIRGYAFFRYNHIHRIKLLTTVIIRPPQTGRLQFQCLVNIRSKDNRFPLLRCKVYFLSHLFSFKIQVNGYLFGYRLQVLHFRTYGNFSDRSIW